MSKFKLIKTSIEGLCIIEPTVFGDARGFFMETFSERDFQELGITEKFVQDNHSKSKKGVLRGLHLQRRHPQGKLVRVTRGSVLDVAVDMRPESPTYGKWESVMLSEENKRMFYIPAKFAHGFLTLEDNTEFIYKCTDYYDPEFEGGIIWNDPTVKVDWQLDEFGIDNITVSEKDKQNPLFNDINPDKLWL